MKKPLALSAVSIYIATLIATVNAQTAEPSNANSQNTGNLIGQVIASVGVIVVFAVIAYAGYKIVRKWSNSQSD